MKKILIITPFFYPHVGGSERYMEELYAYIKEKYPAISVDVLCYDTDKAKATEEYRGLNIYRIPCWTILPGQFCLPSPLPLFKFLQSHKSYDLVHSSTRFFDNSWWAPLYAKSIKAKVVLTDHCSSHPVSGNSFIDLLIRLIEETIVRFSLHNYDEIYAENKKTRDFLKRNFNVSSQVAYPGLSHQDKGSFEHKNNKRLKIVYVGRMIKSKGVGDLFEIARNTPKADFFLAGDGQLKSSLKEKKQVDNLTNIHILGNLSKIEVSRLLKSADIFVYPSRHSEGLPLALVEAGSSKVAVVATDSGAIGELIQDNRTGLLVKSGDRQAFKAVLDKLIKDKSLRLKLGKNLYNFTLANFSWEKPTKMIIDKLQ